MSTYTRYAYGIYVNVATVINHTRYAGGIYVNVATVITYTRHAHNIYVNLDHSKTQKCYLYQVIPIWNSLPSSLKKCTSKFTYKKKIKAAFWHPNLGIFLIIKVNSPN